MAVYGARVTSGLVPEVYLYVPDNLFFGKNFSTFRPPLRKTRKGEFTGGSLGSTVFTPFEVEKILKKF